jgi:nucleoside-diphosphate-sugar epimerase
MADGSYLVTGAHGFIGAWVVKRLLALEAEVVLFDRSPDPRRLRLIMNDDEIARAKLVEGDITDETVLRPIIAGFGITSIIHLAGLQVPSCRSDPKQGALVNVVGTLNVFEAARASGGQINRIVYASSAAVFGSMEDERPVTEQDSPNPSSHYGAFKRCNEDNARVYYLDNGIHSIGLRPLTVYGVGRDFGVTSDPTKAMKAAVVGRAFHIRFGGRTDLQYVADTADAFIRSAQSDLDGAHVFNLHGDVVHMTEIIEEIERAWPESRSRITFTDTPLLVPAAMDDAAYRAALGQPASTPLTRGVRETIERFALLHREGRLDTDDLDQ